MMEKEQWMLVTDFCITYQVELDFVQILIDNGTISVEVIDQKEYLHEEVVLELEMLVRISKDLEIPPQQLDVIYSLLNKVRHLQSEVSRLQKELNFYQISKF